MFNLFSPIGINTPVNSITLPYFLNLYAPYSYGAFTPFNSGDSYFNPYQYGSVLNYYPQNYSYYDYSYQSASKSNENDVKKNKPVQNKPAQKVDLRKNFLTVANKYSDCKESDNSHAKFCVNKACKTDDPENKEWCTDFVTYVVNETYKDKGKKPPIGFGNHDVGELKRWADKNGYFLNTSNAKDKQNLITQKVKPGDIVIFNEAKSNGDLASHTGFVQEVKPDGTFTTIEGNRNDRVANATYNANYNLLSGCIQLE